MKKEVVSIFTEFSQLEAAIDELSISSFDRADISLLAEEASITKKLGHSYQNVREIADLPDIPKNSYIATENIGIAEGSVIAGLAYIGTVVAAATVLAGGNIGNHLYMAALSGGAAGGFVGSVLATLIGKHHADFIEHQLRLGGLVLFVTVHNEQQLATAKNILAKYQANDIHVNESVP